MTENLLAKEMLRMAGVFEPTKSDVRRVARRLKLESFSIPKKLLVFALLKGANVFVNREEDKEDAEDGR